MNRSVENTAAASVEATTAPSSMASSQVMSKSPRAATPVTHMLTTTPSVLSSPAGTTTGRIRDHELCSPPS